MAVTVREALKIWAFTGCRLVAGDGGIDSPISYAGAMEIPDIKPWLAKSQLLITTGYALREDSSSITALVQDLHDSQCSGLAIKTRFTGPLPAEALALADTLNLPVIEIPAQIPFIDLVNPLAKAVADEHGKILEFSQRIHAKFIALQIDGCGFQNIVGMVSRLMGASVRITSERFEIIAEELIHGTLTDLFDTVVRERRKALEAFSQQEKISMALNVGLPGAQEGVVRKIILHHEIRGYLFVFAPRSIDQMDSIVVDHAATVCALEFSKLCALQEQHRIMENSLFVDIITGNVKSEEEAFYRARNLKWPAPPFSVAVFDIDSFEDFTKSQSEADIQQVKGQIGRTIETHLLNNGGGVPVINSSDSFICIIPGSEPKKQISTGMSRVIRSAQENLRVGISAGVAMAVERYSDLQVVHGDIDDVIRIVRALKLPEPFAFVSDLRFEQAMLRISDNGHLRQLVASTVGKLWHYDEKNGTDLISTLDAFLENMGVHTKTARQLFIHRNTLSYRLKKIGIITGCDLDSPQNIFSLGVALKAEKYIR